MKIYVVFYSMYGHIFEMAKAAAEGVYQAPGAKAELFTVPETLPEEVLKKMGAVEPQKRWADVPVIEAGKLPEADGLIFCTPTRFGNMCGQMKQFVDSWGGLWMNRSLVGKPAGVISSSNTQHGGQEATILSFHIVLLHQGMVICGLPYAFEGQMTGEEITGCSPYGASTIAGPDGSRMPSSIELDGARWQGRYIAEIAAKLAA
jgi:NAD(P)H dehydrogenase (quinone)